MSIFDKFLSSNPPKPAEQPATPASAPATPTPPGNIPEPTVASEPGQGTHPTIPENLPTQGETPDSPLAKFESLWEPNPTNPENPSEGPKPLSAEQVSTAVSKTSFTSGISEEQINAIYSGGEAAATALPQILDAVAQQVMTKATLVGQKLTEQQVAAALANRDRELPNILREQAVTEHLRTTNPLLDNPAIKPVAEATKSQLLAKYPNATNEEITRMTVDFLTEMSSAVNPQQSQQVTDPGTDWSKFLDM